MSEEHGYQRSGKKCREKFENLYKYYKKTKEGKAGRQDGKHYRFFRQLEALYGGGEPTNSVSLSETHFAATAQAHQEAYQSQKHFDISLSVSNCSEFGSSSSDDNDISTAALMESDASGEIRRRKRRGGRSWQSKIKAFINSQMRKLMEKQEAWVEKMMSTLEQKEKERMSREEEWRKQETTRMEVEHRLWAKERARIEARDAALMESLKMLTEGDMQTKLHEGFRAIDFNNENPHEDGSEILNNNSAKGDDWQESEITRLVQLWTSLGPRFHHRGREEEALWKEIAAEMGCLGYDRSASSCKEKWESINNYMRKSRKTLEKSRKASSNYNYFQHSGLFSPYNQAGTSLEINEQADNGSSPSSCFRLLMSEGETMWGSYGVKINNGDHNYQ